MSNIQDNVVSHQLGDQGPAVKKKIIRPRRVEIVKEQIIDWTEEVRQPLFPCLQSLLSMHSYGKAKLCMKVHDYYSPTTKQEQDLLLEMENTIAISGRLWSKFDFEFLLFNFDFHLCYEQVKSTSKLLVAPDRSVPKQATIVIEEEDWCFGSPSVLSEAVVIEHESSVSHTPPMSFTL